MKLFLELFLHNKQLIIAIAVLLVISTLFGIAFDFTSYFIEKETRKLSVFLLTSIYLGSVFTMAFGITPATLVSFLSGFFIGWQAILPVILAYMAASILGYFAAKLLDKGKLKDSISEKTNYEHWFTQIESQPFAAVFFAKISPAIPFAISNFLLAALNVKLPIFLLASLVGMLPRTLLAIWIGLQAKEVINGSASVNQGWLIILLLVISVFGFYLMLGKRADKN